MKKFFRSVFTSCLGTLLALTLVGLVGFVLFYQNTKKDKNLKKASFLSLSLQYVVPEKTGNTPQNFNLEMASGAGVNDILRSLEHAAQDDMIAGLLIKSNYTIADMVSIQRIRRAIEKFKTSGKPIYSYGEYYSQSAYHLASTADSVFLNPNGSIDIRGLGAATPFYKGLMDKLGVKMNIFYQGKYKSAIEPYRRNSMSPDNKDQKRIYLNQLNSELIREISNSRNLPEADIREIMNNYLGGSASDAVKHGLADEVVYYSDVKNILRKKLNQDEDQKTAIIPVSKYLTFLPKKSTKSEDKIAVIYAEGILQYGKQENGKITNDKYLNLIERIKRNKNIKSVVLRVNSRGGSSLASDNIAMAIKDLSDSGIPVIASFGGYAASGGYYIAAYADTIISEKTTLTGSIGIYSMFPDVHKLLNEKIGITYDTVLTQDLSRSFTNVMKLTDKENEIMQKYTDETYSRFIEVVSEGRDMSIDDVRDIAQGRVWSGTDAVKIGLVDEIGDLTDAIDIAASSADIENYDVVEYPRIEKSPIESIMNLVSPQAQAGFKGNIPDHFLKQLNFIKQLSSIRTPQARIDWELIGY